MAPEDFDEQQALLTNAPQAEPSLTARVVRGTAWVFAGKIVGRGLQLVTLVVLARLLTPEDFGLFGIVMLAVATLETFSETGFGTALIQRKGNIEAYLDTAWTVQVIRGFVLAGILYASAPVVGWFFNEPRVVLPLRVMCLSEVVRGFTNIGIIYFQKELQFHKQVAYNLLGSLASVAVGIPLAFYLRSVWALVWAAIALSATNALSSYLLHSFRPRPRIDLSQAADLFRFGRWVLGSSMLIFLIGKGDSLLVGKVLGASALGLYQIAHRIANLPATELTHTLSAVTFPAYASIQLERERLTHAYFRVLRFTTAVTVPAGIALLLLAPELVTVLFGPTWAEMVVPLRVLAVYGVIRSIAAANGPLFHGSGNPRSETIGLLLKLIFMGSIIYPLTKSLGLLGAGLSITLPVVASQSWAISQVVRITQSNLRTYFATLFMPLMSSAAMALVVMFVKLLCVNPLASLIAGSLAGAVTYLIVMTLSRGFPVEIRRLGRNLCRTAIQQSLTVIRFSTKRSP